MPIDSLEQRIDTNKRNGMETSEIVNFLKNDSNVQELGKKLETTFNSNWLDRQNNQKFHDAVENTTINNKAFQTRIENIVKKGTGGLTDTDVFLLYLQSKIDGTLAMKPIISKKGDIYTRYGGQLLLNYIRSKYKNPKYEFWRGWPDIIPQAPTKNKPKALIENQKRETKLPTNIDFSTFGENNTHMPKEFSKLDTRAKENFSTEYNKEKIASRKRNSEKGEKINDYIQYDLLIFSLKKYQELIEKKINGVTNGIYGNEQYCKLQQNLAKSYFQDLEIINKEFPDIQDIIKNISNYFKDLEKLQKKYLGNQKEEVIQKKYEAYLKEIDNKGKELGINEQGIPKEINKFEDVVKILENTEKIAKFQEFQEKIKIKYGKSVINNYEKYINEKGNLINKYGKDNLQKSMDTYKKYGEKVNDCKNRYRQKGFDEKKYNEYIKKISESDIPRHMENIQILSNSINIKDGKVPENFPIRSIKEDYEKIQREQAETDKLRENLKNKSRLLYQICNIGSRGINALVSSTRGTGAKLGALVSSLWHDDDEMIAVWERANNGFWNPNIPISARQAQSAYEKGEIILNWDNGPGIVSEGIVSMLTLVAGGGAITKGLTKGATKIGIGMGTKLARGTGLVSSGFIQQAGPSFGEGLSAGMTGNQAMLYAITSATLQGSLELLSPNEFINGLGKNLAKTYIKEILKSESKQSLKAVGKLFLKNVGSEIGEEIIQEEVQLAAGNIINMRANNQYDLGKDGLKADWNRKNFAATAIVTALTTGFVAGGGFAMKSPGMGNNQNREQLIGHIQKNNELHSDVMNVLDKAIAGKFKIPNVDAKQLQELKGILSSNVTTGNTDYFNGKSKKLFEGDGIQARSNSEMMDNILNEIKKEGITETEITEKLGELRKLISEQYKQSTGEKLELTDEQLLSILDAHEQDGVLGELTIGQLRQKVKILNETITDPKVRRFLLEAGFCGQEGINDNYTSDINELAKKLNLKQYEIENIEKSIELINKTPIQNGIRLGELPITEILNNNYEGIKDLVKFIPGPYQVLIFFRDYLALPNQKLGQLEYERNKKLQEILSNFSEDIKNKCKNAGIDIDEKLRILKGEISLEEAKQICTDEKIIKLAQNKEGIINKHALELAMKLSNWKIHTNEIGLIFELGNNEYTKIKELIRHLEKELSNANLSINNVGEIIQVGESHGKYRFEYLLKFYLIDGRRLTNHYKMGDIKHNLAISLMTNSLWDHYREYKGERRENLTNLIYQSAYAYMSKEEKQALGDYKETGKGINKTANDPNNKTSKIISQYLERMPLKEDIEVERKDPKFGIAGKIKLSMNGETKTLSEILDTGEKCDETNLEQSSFIRDSFISTTVHNYQTAPIVWHFTVKKGVGAGFLDVLGFHSEGEVLLDKNCKITITKLEASGGGAKIYATVEKQSEQGKKDTYFDGKSQKIFKGDTKKAESNSKTSDRILSEINEQNKSAKLEELRKEISEQYKQSTGEELNLTDEQLLSVLDAHEQDGELGKLKLGELKVKVKILSEAITNENVRRFLLEAGFCGSEKNIKTDITQDIIRRLDYRGYSESTNTEIINFLHRGCADTQNRLNYIDYIIGCRIEEHNVTRLLELYENANIPMQEHRFEFMTYYTEHGIYEKYKYTSEIEKVLKKIKKLEELGLRISTREIEEYNKIERDFEKLSKLKDLGVLIDKQNIQELNNFEFNFENLKRLRDFGINLSYIHEKIIEKFSKTERDFDKLRKLRDEFGIEVNVRNIEDFNNTKRDFEKLNKLRDLGIWIDTYNIKEINNFKFDFEKLTNLKKNGFNINNRREFSKLEISQEEIELCKEYGINNYYDVIFFLSITKNADRGKINDFINRKNKYLETNRTISEQKFKELFGGLGKYDKIEINQDGLGLCYAYTGFELLKKTNGFNELIQTNLKETPNGWEVRIPFCDPNGTRIKINKNEIDKTITITKKNGDTKTECINSKGEMLGFKILEIAFMKKMIINRYQKAEKNIGGIAIDYKYRDLKEAYEEFTNTGDITLTGILIGSLEGQGGRFLYDGVWETMLPEEYYKIREHTEMKDLAFNEFSKGLHKIDLGYQEETINHHQFGTEIIITKNEIFGFGIIVKNAKIINKSGEIIEGKYSIDNEGNITEEIGNQSDIIGTPGGKNAVCFFPHHAYSIEKCYIDQTTGEKRVRVINPRHTGIKFDISLEQCKQIFDWDITGINIDNMFRDNGTSDQSIDNQKENNSDYFNGKSHQFEVTETQARSNSENMDKILSEINEQNKSEKLEELRKTITEQYKESTGEELNLTDEQLLSILDAHEQDGKLGELTLGQLRQKVKILDKTITDPKVKRFLLEAGFCGSIFSKRFKPKPHNNEIPVDALIVGDYQIGEIVNVPRTDGSITPGGTIQEYNASTGKYLVTRDQDGQPAQKWVSNEKLNNVNKANPEEESDIIMINPEEESDIIMINPEEESDIIMINPEEESDIIMINPEEESDIINNQQSRGINTERKEMSEVHRNSDVVAIGDLHGEYKALKGNMEFAGLAREINGHLEWTGGNKKVVFQGDILADRGTDGLRIIQEIHKLREQARKEGGDIDIIVGNHDDFMISYLTGRNGVHGKGLEIASLGQQGKGLTELAKFIGRKVGDFDSLNGTGIRQEIFQAMRNDPEGRMILEEICNMKLVSQVDDVLYIHTNPTAKMLEYLTKGNVQQNINLLNQKYQGYLRNALLGEGGGNISLEEFNNISDIFLYTNNRPKYGSETGLEKYTEILKNSGINMISHGHNGGNGYRIKRIGGIKIVDTDHSYGHSGDYSGEHSVSVIKKEGGVNYIGDNVAHTNLDYPIGTEVLFVNNLGQELKVKVVAYDPVTKRYRISDEEQGISREVTAESLKKINNDNYFDQTSRKEIQETNEQTNKYTKDVNGNILPENYEKMSAEELIQEYQHLRDYEANGTIRFFGYGETKIPMNSHNCSSQKAQIREILKAKYNLDKNGNPIKTSSEEIQETIEQTDGYTKDVNGNILPENYKKMSAEELIQEYQHLKDYEAKGTIRFFDFGETKIPMNSHNCSSQKAQIREILKAKYNLDKNGNPIKTSSEEIQETIDEDVLNNW